MAHDDDSVRGWFSGKRWSGQRPFVYVSWLVVVVLLALCVFFMVAHGHTSPAFDFRG